MAVLTDRLLCDLSRTDCSAIYLRSLKCNLTSVHVALLAVCFRGEFSMPGYKGTPDEDWGWERLGSIKEDWRTKHTGATCFSPAAALKWRGSVRQMTGTIGDGAGLAARTASAGICRRIVWQGVRWVSMLPQDHRRIFDHGVRGAPQHVWFDVWLPILLSPGFAFSDLSSGEDTLLCMCLQIRAQI